MSRTVIPWGSPHAVKRWSANLAAMVNKTSYFEKKFVGRTENSIIQRKTELESGPGDRIQYELSVQLRQRPTYGDARLEGKEENLKFFEDEVAIDQLRHAVSTGGRMTRKRVPHNMRVLARQRLAEYWARFLDEMLFIYLSGARGINEDFIEAPDWTGHARNPIQAPDDGHILFGGSAVSKQTITADDIMSREVVEKAVTKATMLNAVDPESASMPPLSIDGEGHYCMVMSPFQEHSMRTKDPAGWLEIQKAAAAAEGRNNPIFKGGLGMINNCVLHKHVSAIRFNDYGASGDLPAARALFMSRQAGAIAYGSERGARFTWEEQVKDYGNEPTVASGTIMGVKKCRFNNRDFGVLAVDTYAADPNA